MLTIQLKPYKNILIFLTDFHKYCTEKEVDSAQFCSYDFSLEMLVQDLCYYS
jgi:hypothetical protein